jgi:hypothetical protein
MNGRSSRRLLRDFGSDRFPMPPARWLDSVSPPTGLPSDGYPPSAPASLTLVASRLLALTLRHVRLVCRLVALVLEVKGGRSGALRLRQPIICWLPAPSFEVDPLLNCLLLKDVTYPDEAALERLVKLLIDALRFLRPRLIRVRSSPHSAASSRSSADCLRSSRRPRSRGCGRISRKSPSAKPSSSRAATVPSSLTLARRYVERSPACPEPRRLWLQLSFPLTLPPAQDPIEHKLSLILLMSLIVIWGGRLPVVRIMRIAGQYAKPRSSAYETVEGHGKVLSFRCVQGLTGPPQ